jgi:uncharacterized protein YndB with AHSA1/START domain
MMDTTDRTPVTVEVIIDAPIDKVWNMFNAPEHIMQWNAASDDWHAPYAKNDLIEGGRLICTMAAKDGSHSFDFSATYNKIIPHESIEYTLDDDRKVSILFIENDEKVTVTESFEVESTHSLELQQNGWQAILNNFKKYVEGN